MKKIYSLFILCFISSIAFSQKLELFADFEKGFNSNANSPINDITEVHNGAIFFTYNEEGARSKLYYTEYITGQTNLLYDFKTRVNYFETIGSIVVASSNSEAFLFDLGNNEVKELDREIRFGHVLESDSLLIYQIRLLSSSIYSYFTITQLGDTATLYKNSDIGNQNLYTLLDSGKLIVSENIPFTNFISIGYYTGDSVTPILTAEDSVTFVKDFRETPNYLYFNTQRSRGDFSVFVIDKNTLVPSVIAKNDNVSLFNSGSTELIHNIGDTLLFTYPDAINGLELWISWGTSSTTSLTKDIASGFSSLNYFTWETTEDYLYFTDLLQTFVFSCNGRGQVDTVKIDGVNIGKNIWRKVVPNSNRIFTIGAGASSDNNIYVINGGANNNYKLLDLFRSKPFYDANFSSTGLFTFIGQEVSGGVTSIYQTLGNQGNFTKIRDVSSINSATILGSGPNGFVYSITDSAVYVQQGDSIAPNLVTSSINPNNTNSALSQALFISDLGNGIHALYTSDGTLNGTKKLYEYEAATIGSDIRYLTKFKNKLFFIANDSIMETDGTQQSLQTLYSSGRFIHVFNDSIYFFTDTAIIVSDGEGFSRTLDHRTQFSGIINAKTYALISLFENGDYNLYKLTDSIRLLKNGIQSTSIGVAIGDSILFSARDPFDNEFELFFTDGTTQNTGFFKNLRPSGSSNPRSFVNVGDKIYFRATDGVGQSLFSSDLTIPGTNRVPFHTSLGNSFSYQNVKDTLLLVDNNKAYFVDSNDQLVEWDNPPVLYSNNSILPTHDFPAKGFKFVYNPFTSGFYRIDINQFGRTFGDDITQIFLPVNQLFGSVILGNKIFGPHSQYKTGYELFFMEVCDFTSNVIIQDYICHDSEPSITVSTSPSGSYNYFLKDRASFRTILDSNSTGNFTNIEDNIFYFIETENLEGCNFVNNGNGTVFSRPDTLQFKEPFFYPIDTGSFRVDIQWDFSGGGPYYLTFTNGEKDTVFSPQWIYEEKRDGIDTVSLTVTNSRGCTISETFISTVSLDELKLSGVKVYPIPTSDILKIEGLDAKSVIQLTDLNGKIKISENSRINQVNSINLNDLAKGIYILQIISKNSTISKKIVVN